MAVSRSMVRGPLALVVLTVSVLVVAGAHAGDAAIRAVPTNLNVSRLAGNQSETTIAINPTNRKNVVIVSNLESGTGLFEAFTINGGTSWTRTTIADGDSLGSACCDPSLAFDSFGNLFLTFVKSSFPDNVPVGLSTDGGISFSLLGSVAPPPGPAPAPEVLAQARRSGPGLADQPTITTGPGVVWVTYEEASGPIVATGASVTGLGSVGSFIAREAVSGKRGIGDYADVAVGPDGQILLTWQKPSGGQGPAKIFVSRDPDGLGPKGLTTPLLATTTNVGGFDYIPAQSGRSVDAEPDVAFDRSTGPHEGRAYLLYTEETPDESNDMDILVRTSDDHGKTWSAPIQINDDTGTNSQFLPRLAVDPTTGNLASSWYDARKDAGTGGAGDTNGVANDDVMFYLSFSTDGGATWQRNRRVSAGTTNAHDAHNAIDLGDYTGLDFYGGNAWPVWADNSNSTGDNPNGALTKLDVYTAKVHLAA